MITIVSITFRQLDINVLRILRLVLSRNLSYILIGIEYCVEEFLSYMIIQQIEMRNGLIYTLNREINNEAVQRKLQLG